MQNKKIGHDAKIGNKGFRCYSINQSYTKRNFKSNERNRSSIEDDSLNSLDMNTK